jgi:hypothetical protein
MEPNNPRGGFAAVMRYLAQLPGALLHLDEPAEWVPPKREHTKAVLRRRAKNRVARRSRRINRLRAQR